MNKIISGVIMLFVFMVTVMAQNSERQMDKEVMALLKKMTIEEKAGQLVQPFYAASTINDVEQRVVNGQVGSILLTKQYRITPEQRNEIQRMAVEETRLGIPLFFGYDVIHGFKTIFPNPLGLASSWDEELVADAAAVAADEARHWGLDMAFSPNVDVSRDPRWGRIAECASEDVLLSCRMGAATVRGFQGENMANESSMASCVKHFVGDADCLGGRDKAFTEISRRALLETYLPPFKACIDAGSPSVMVTFNDIAGVPVAANHYAMTEVMRDDWGFDGIALSDWDAVVELQSHGVAKDDKDAAMQAFNAGMDVEMKSYTFDHLVELVKEKKVKMKRLNEAVIRVLKLKYRLGLFDNPYVDVNKSYKKQLTTENRKEARRIAAESMILLKNDGVLPLNTKSVSKNISVVGSTAHTQDLLGYWVGMGANKDVVTIYDGIKNNAPTKLDVFAGTDRSKKRPISIVCVGERGDEFGESQNVVDITLSKSQVELVKEVKRYSKKVIVVVCSGRPLALTPIMDYADAIIQAWHPGTEAGNAVADVLFGTVNPSGKTTCSFVKHTGQIPIFYSDRTSGRPRVNRYNTMDAKPLFPFGYGLSYTSFEYSDFKLSANKMTKKGGNIKATVTVKNTGKVKGKEVVQLYIHDKVASVTVPKQRLIDFKKVEVLPGESIEVAFNITPEQLTLIDMDFNEVAEKGDFVVWVGRSSVDVLKDEFTLE